jgi:hypothetical protein
MRGDGDRAVRHDGGMADEVLERSGTAGDGIG